jgi:hypothetical protein
MRMHKLCVCGYGMTDNEISNMSRHKKICPELKSELTRLKLENEQLKNGEELIRLKARLVEFENGEAFSQLKRENDDLKNQLLDALKKNQRPRVTNNTTNNTINLNIYAWGEEPQLTEERIRGFIQNAVDLGQVVPQLLREKHFKDDRTANIRIDVGQDKIETVRRDEKTGRLKWKKERKAPKKFCQDLAMSTMNELNDACEQDMTRGSSRIWKSYYENRFGKEPMNDGVNHAQKVGTRVCNLIKAHATKEDEDDMVD